MDFILSYISEELIYALGWTVIHSLWQAAIIALMLAFFMQGVQRKTAKLRYEVATFSLFLVFVFALCTFVYMYESATQTPEGFSYLIQHDLTVIAVAETPGQWLDITNSWAAYFNRNMPLIVSIWLLGGLFFLLRLLGGYAYTQRLKYQHNQLMSAHWQQKLNMLIRKTPISKPVYLLESALIKVPMVIGYFKPVILLPIGIVNALRDEEVEAIIAHELAHIYRNDYLTNIILSCFEILFYYNPSVWWISANIRTERENCCDDIGVQLCGSSLTYAKALVSIQEMHHAAPSFAMSFSGSKNQLLQRIKRILNQPQNKSVIMEKLTATCLLLFAILILSVSAGVPFEPSFVEEEKALAPLVEFTPEFLVEATAIAAPEDTVPVKKNKQRYIKTTDDQKVEITMEDGEITKLEIDGKKIPVEEIAEHSELTEDVLEEMQALPERSNHYPGLLIPDRSMPSFFNTKKKTIVSTDQNAEGNTVIIVEEEGGEEPLEIVVEKEGPVIFIDGEAIETGDTAFIFEEGNHFFEFKDFDNFKVHGHNFPEIKLDNQILKLRELDKLYEVKGLNGIVLDDQSNWAWVVPETLGHLEHIEQLQGHIHKKDKELKMIEKERKELLKRYRDFNKEQSKEQKAKQKAMMKELRAIREQEAEVRKEYLEKHRDEVKEQMELRRAEMKERQQYRLRNNLSFRTQVPNVSSMITDELLKDGLIQSKEKFSFSLSNKKFKVNGKKMSKEVHEKYKDLYFKHSNAKPGANFNVQVRNN